MGVLSFKKKVRITGSLSFDTAFHIGTGREGDLATDMGILKDIDQSPILPGSSLKGNFRAFAERLAGYLGLKACLLSTSLSGINCVSDESYRKSVHEQFKCIVREDERITWLQEHTCDVCQLFGSPLQASRIYFSDGILMEWSRTYQIRDGVCIDRDSETARHGAKFDYEVVPQGALYSTSIEIDNPEDKDLALVGAVLREWENGFRLGGFKSRGLGKVKLSETKIEQVDYTDVKQLREYILNRKMTNVNIEDIFNKSMEKFLGLQGGTDA